MDRGSYERELVGRPPTSRGAALVFRGKGEAEGRTNSIGEGFSAR